MKVDKAIARRARHDASFTQLPVVYLPEDPYLVHPASEKDPARWRYLIAAALAVAAIAAAIARMRRVVG